MYNLDIAACIRTIKYALRYLIWNIHNNIGDEISEGMQGVLGLSLMCFLNYLSFFWAMLQNFAHYAQNMFHYTPNMHHYVP